MTSISRRDVVKIGAAGLIAPAIGAMAAPTISVAQQKTGDVPMFRGNAARTGEMPGPVPDGTNGIEVLWQFETGGQLRTPPAIVDGTAFLGSGDGNLYALSVQDGIERWRFSTSDLFESGPAVAGDTVFFGSEDHHLHAVDASTGEERWRFRAGTYAGSPAVADGIVLASGGSQGNMNLVALDAQDGAERWRFANESMWYLVPAIAGGSVFVSIAASVHALDLLTGQEVWRVTAEDGQQFGHMIAVANDTVYVTGDGGVFALDVQGGVERWRTAPEQFITGSIAVAGDTMFAGSGEYHTVAAANAHDGSSLWLSTVDGAEPDLANPSRYGFSNVAVADDTVFATRSFNEIYAFDVRDGSERWVFRLHPSGKNYLTAPVVVDGLLLIGSSLDNGTLYALGERIPRLEAGATAHVTGETPLRGAPAPSGVARADLQQGMLVTVTGEAVITAGITWWPVRLDSTGHQGWVEGSLLAPIGTGG